LHRLASRENPSRIARRKGILRARLNGIFAESIRGYDERQDKTKLFSLRTFSQISDARDKTQKSLPRGFVKVWQESSNKAQFQLGR